MQKAVYEFISKQNNDPIIERRICRRTGKEFPIFQKEKEMLEKISPVVGGKKIKLSLPQLSPEARQIKRLMFRNERKFYKLKNKDGKTEITTIAPEMGFKIVSQKEFFESDNSKYYVDYSGDFRSDLKELFHKMPYPAKLIHNMENADYCNQETDDKNCYLNAGGHYNENSMYNTYSIRGKWTVDNFWVLESQQIYKSINIHKSQKVIYSEYIENCFNVLFSYDLVGCQNILFCHGLRNASYAYKNKVLPKEEREKIYKEYKAKISTYSGFMEAIEEYNQFIGKQAKKAVWNINVENVVGAELNNVQNNFFVNSGEGSQDTMYSNIYAYLKDSMDIESMGRAQKCYNCASSLHVNDVIVGSHMLDNISKGAYLYFCKNSSFLTGCMGLNHKKYHILNKQYEQEQREKITIQILEQLQKEGKLGEFFDPEFSPFPYNDTVAMEYYPVTEDQVKVLEPEKFISDAILDLGGEEKIKIKRRTKEQEINIPEGIETIKADVLPESIEDMTDEILNKVILCKETGRPFRIIGMELDFYRMMGLPLPRIHPDVRHTQKIKRRPGRNLSIRNCDKCGGNTLSVYNKQAHSKVYCEGCYNKEIY